MIAAGCLVQWYEVDMFEEYIDSLILSIGDNKNKVLIDIRLVTNQKLEKINSNGNLQRGRMVFISAET